VSEQFHLLECHDDVVIASTAYDVEMAVHECAALDAEGCAPHTLLELAVLGTTGPLSLRTTDTEAFPPHSCAQAGSTVRQEG
jgi:hypothetical protein